MKNFVLAGLAGGWLCCSACAHHSQQTISQQQDSLSNPDSTRNVFFPVRDFLESEITRVDSLPMAMKKYNTRNGRRDSSFILLPEFNALARQFLAPEFSDGRFESQFTESSFVDKSTESVNFTYATANKDLSLQRVDVVASLDGKTNQVRSIYLEKSSVAGDSVIQQKMYWQAGRNFQIISLIRVKNRTPYERQVKVVWDNE
jgi:hypothetical protein